MKKMILMAGLALLPVVWSGTALAGNSSGCGFGTEIFKGQSGVAPNVMAVTTNGSTYNAFFGISSGTLGCQQDGVVLNEHERNLYAAANLRQLKAEMAHGQGEYLDGLAALMGVGESDMDAFRALSRSSLPTLLEAPDSARFLAALDREMAADPALAHYVTTP